MHVLDAPRTESSHHSKHDPAHINAHMALNFGYVVGCIKVHLLVKFRDICWLDQRERGLEFGVLWLNRPMARVELGAYGWE